MSVVPSGICMYICIYTLYTTYHVFDISNILRVYIYTYIHIYLI